MTRKDYVKLAAVLNENRPDPGDASVPTRSYKVWESIVHGIAQVLGDDNPRFDYDRFYKACGREKVEA